MRIPAVLLELNARHKLIADRFSTRTARVTARRKSALIDVVDAGDADVISTFISLHMMPWHFLLKVVIDAGTLYDFATDYQQRVETTLQLAAINLPAGSRFEHDDTCDAVLALATSALRKAEVVLQQEQTAMLHKIPSMLEFITQLQDRRPSLQHLTAALHGCLLAFVARKGSVPNTLTEARADLNHAIVLLNKL